MDLGDPAGVGQRFLDVDLNRAVGRAVGELSLAAPRLVDTEVVLAGATRRIELPVGTFPGLMDVDEIEWPYGAGGSEAEVPPGRPPFRLAADRLSVLLLTDEVLPAGARLRVRWASPYLIGEGSTTVPAELDHVVARGAYGFACLAYSTPAADNFRYEDGATVAGVDDSMIPTAWRVRAIEALGDFRGQLAVLRQRRAESVTIGWMWARSA